MPPKTCMRNCREVSMVPCHPNHNVATCVEDLSISGPNAAHHLPIIDTSLERKICQEYHFFFHSRHWSQAHYYGLENC